MSDDHSKLIDFEFHDDRGRLFVILDRPTFEEIVNAIQERAGIVELAEIEAVEVSEILVWDSSRVPKSAEPSWLKDRLLLLGCGFVASIFAMVFFIGILALIGIIPR